MAQSLSSRYTDNVEFIKLFIHERYKSYRKKLKTRSFSRTRKKFSFTLPMCYMVFDFLVPPWDTSFEVVLAMNLEYRSEQ